MIIVGVDVETNGASQDARDVNGKTDEERAQAKTDIKSEIVELGLVLFDVTEKIILASYGCILSVDKWGPNAELIHGIPERVSTKMPKNILIDPWTIINGDMASFIVAHNASHDHPIVTACWKSFLNKPWLCTQNDLLHNEVLNSNGKKLLHRPPSSMRLGHLCVDYNINLGGWHRAQADAEACARIAAFHDLDKAFEYKNKERFKLSASGPFIKDFNTLMKEAPSVKSSRKKYIWDDEKKLWWKENLFEEEIKADHTYIKSITKGKWEFYLEKMPPKPY